MREINFEIYTMNPQTGETGWDIKFVSVIAEDKEKALELLKKKPLFDVVILTEYNMEINLSDEQEGDEKQYVLTDSQNQVRLAKEGDILSYERYNEGIYEDVDLDTNAFPPKEPITHTIENDIGKIEMSYADDFKLAEIHSLEYDKEKPPSSKELRKLLRKAEKWAFEENDSLNILFVPQTEAVARILYDANYGCVERYPEVVGGELKEPSKESVLKDVGDTEFSFTKEENKKQKQKREKKKTKTRRIK